MQQNHNIKEELNQLNSNLAGMDKTMPYSLPANYFTELSKNVLGRIAALSELEELSPSIAGLSKETLYNVPEGYFDRLAFDVQRIIADTPETANEELKGLSPLLAGISKKSPYSVPAGYLENISLPVKEQNGAKVISISRQSWFRFAAAAVVTAFIVTIGFMFLNKNEIDPDIKPTAWVEKKLKKVSTDEIDEFVDLVDDNVATANTPTPAEVKLLMQEVSPEDIESFLDEVELAEPSAEGDILN